MRRAGVVRVDAECCRSRPESWTDRCWPTPFKILKKEFPWQGEFKFKSPVQNKNVTTVWMGQPQSMYSTPSAFRVLLRSCTRGSRGASSIDRGAGNTRRTHAQMHACARTNAHISQCTYIRSSCCYWWPMANWTHVQMSSSFLQTTWVIPILVGTAARWEAPQQIPHCHFYTPWAHLLERLLVIIASPL